MTDKEKDLCKTCEHHWVDFLVTTEKVYIPRCDKLGIFTNMDEVVSYPCLKCPFNSYSKKQEEK